MINFENCTIGNIIIHDIGNKYDGGTLKLSGASFLPDDEDVLNILKNYFLSSFKKDAFYNFIPLENELYNNPVYAAVDTIFGSEQEFYTQSVTIAEQLFEQSNNPNIKQGELYIVHFRSCMIDEGVCDAIGIFKSENKDTFLKIIRNNDSYKLESESGINIKKLDKACLVFNMNKEEGYKACVVDKTNASEAIYWVSDFLNLQPCDDSYFQTSNYLKLCKDFVNEVYNKENDIPRADQIDMLNRSINFFKEADVFSEDRFKEEVVQEPEIINAFENFKSMYEQDKEIQMGNEFEVSDFAVKDEKKYFKHILKLDKNFHVYIHGQKKYLEKGYDSARDMNFYKLYFREEN